MRMKKGIQIFLKSWWEMGMSTTSAFACSRSFPESRVFLFQSWDTEKWRNYSKNACIEKLVPRTEIQDKIMLELSMYKKAEGLFGIPLAERSRKTRAPGKKEFISNLKWLEQWHFLKIKNLTSMVYHISLLILIFVT